MNYWPGTNIPKSNGNAFTSWKTSKGSVISRQESAAKQMQTNGMIAGKVKEKLNAKNTFTIYTKA